MADRVFILGFDANPYKYLKGADLFIFGSNHEGFPNVLLEAMACGLPLLTTNCKSGPDEIMEMDNPLGDELMFTKYGILVPVNHPRLMTEGIKYMMNNPSFSEKCKKEVKRRISDFDLNQILEQYTIKILD